MKFIDLFAGIGGFRLGMEMAGHKPVGWCEVDKFAQRSYKAMYDTKGEWFKDDIRTIDARDIPDFDCITGGFPCQSFSIAGKRGGFEDTRGTLFFEIARIIREREPKLVFLENVRGLLNHDGGRTFGTILNTFWELGYDVEWQLLNSKDFGVPHNRERVFIIGYPRGTSREKIFPIRGNNSNTAKGFQGDISGKGYASQQDRVYEIDGLMGCLPATQTKSKTKILLKSEIKQIGNIVKTGKWDNPQRGRVYDSDGISPSLNTMQGGGLIPKVLIKYKIRELTPKECWRLQGFPDELFEKAREVNSDSQLYKQAGNSVTVNVIYEIAKRF